MKDAMGYITTERASYPICFNLNVMEALQEHYGSMNEWGRIVEGDGEPNIKDLKIGLMEMINEGIDIRNEENNEQMPFVTSKQVGRIISEVGFTEVVKAIKELTIKSTSTGEQAKNE